MKATTVSPARREYIVSRLNTSLNAADFRPIWHGDNRISGAVGLITFQEDKVFWGNNALEKAIVLNWLCDFWKRLIVCKTIVLVGQPIRDQSSGEICFGYRYVQPKLPVENLDRLTDRLKNSRKKKPAIKTPKRRK